MKENDKLPKVIAAIATILFIAFIITASKLAEVYELQGLESGNIQHAKITGQY